MEKRPYVRKKPPVKRGSKMAYEDKKAQGFYYVKRKYFKEVYARVQEILKEYESPLETKRRMTHPRNRCNIEKIIHG